MHALWVMKQHVKKELSFQIFLSNLSKPNFYLNKFLSSEQSQGACFVGIETARKEGIVLPNFTLRTEKA